MDYLPRQDQILSEQDILQLNPLALAFIGDAVQQLMVRTRLVAQSTAKAGELHKRATEEIKATAQAKQMERILPYLTEAEESVYRRTRNTKMNTMAKHASVTEYRKASGFEAVLGYLYLLGKNERLSELIEISQSKGEQDESKT